MVLWLVWLGHLGIADSQPLAADTRPVALGSGEWLTAPLGQGALDLLVASAAKPNDSSSVEETSPPTPPSWAADRDFAEVVAALVVNGSGRPHCAGVLIAPRYVVTSRHCLPIAQVLFGEDVRQPRAARKIVAVQVPPDRSIDAALLQLERPVFLPPPVWRRAADSAWPAGTVRAVGFGSTQRRLNQVFGRKRYIDMPASGWGCDVPRARATGCQPDFEMLLVPTADRDTCEGDSGGPLYEEYKGRRRLLGITSRSIDGAGARMPCGAGGIYLRLDRLAPWLEPLLKQEALPHPITPTP